MIGHSKGIFLPHIIDEESEQLQEEKVRAEEEWEKSHRIFICPYCNRAFFPFQLMGVLIAVEGEYTLQVKVFDEVDNDEAQRSRTFRFICSTDQLQQILEQKICQCPWQIVATPYSEGEEWWHYGFIVRLKDQFLFWNYDDDRRYCWIEQISSEQAREMIHTRLKIYEEEISCFTEAINTLRSSLGEHF